MNHPNTKNTLQNISWARLSVMPATVLVWLVVVLSLSVLDVEPRKEKLAFQNDVVEFQK